MSGKTVVFIHGLFLSYNGWGQWVKYFESKGYNAIAIAWPGRDKSVAALRQAHPDPKLGQRTFGEVLDHHIQTIKGLNEPPIIIGHSLGGLFTQLLLNRGLGAAGIAIDSAPPQGLLSFKWSFLKSAFPLLNPLNPSSKPYLMPFSGFQYSFVNGMPLEAQRRAYDEQVVPESLRIARGSLTVAAKVDYAKPHAPLLFIAGETDHIIPPSLNKANFNKYQASAPSITEFKEFPGRNHYGLGADGWQEMADYILEWIAKHKV